MKIILNYLVVELWKISLGLDKLAKMHGFSNLRFWIQKNGNI
jgi:hypothetical protein